VTWTRYIFKEHRTHVVPKRLAHAILHDMTTLHGAELETERPHTSAVSKWTIDLGGMWPVGAPSEEVHLRGLTIRVPCHHVGLVIEKMRRLTPERLSCSGDLWYGLPHWYDALGMLPQQYHSLLAQLVRLAPRADARSEMFERARARVKTVAVATPDGGVVRVIAP
jgi:hypothetical protein